MVLFEPFMLHFTYRHLFRAFILKYGGLLESNELSLCFIRSTPLPEVVIAFADILLHITESEIYKIEHSCYGNIVNGYPADKDSVHAYFRLTNLTSHKYLIETS